ncbi:MAG: zinc ribbon domain-containing protein [Clostridia bacterium]|nr:zinc ribbon domain-containing protein [Clostridia bacterium]
MGFVALKCPACGADISLDDSKEFGFCSFCGTKVMQEKIIVEHKGTVKMDESDKYQNMIKLANNAFQAKNMQEAYKYYTKALELSQSSALPVFRKAICAAYLSDGDERIAEILSGIRQAMSMTNDPAFKTTCSEDICRFALSRALQKPEFVMQAMCEEYVKAISGTINLLDQLYSFIQKDNEKNVVAYADQVIFACDQVKGKQLEYSAGFASVDGKTQALKNTYTIPDQVRSQAQAMRAKYVKERNQFISPVIDEKTAAVKALKEKIKSTSMPLWILHIVFCVPMLILALVLIVFKPALGWALFAIELVAFIVANMMDKEKAVQSMYNELRAMKKELAEMKKQKVK